MIHREMCPQCKSVTTIVRKEYMHPALVCMLMIMMSVLSTCLTLVALNK